ncbi:IS1634 family transposase [Alkaliphilus metalliredigens]|uniref:IS1634 family transposase n=1 Tax=Alkaliphilus metalliredigens TaxID=208226 RepID=UPI0002DD8635|nr:IS1634 family transposase [Alkaliphilus metalliredigens]
MKHYGIKVKTLNFDTTSKVMWGLYETTEGTEGSISIDFGHSKNKRSDKKQIKFGIGCAKGLPVDAQVLSGNKDDKTYNNDVLERVDDILDLYEVDRSEFYYIADSALFSKDNFKAAKEHEIHLITRMADNVTLCKVLMTQALESFDTLEEITHTTAKGQQRHYLFMEKEDDYHGYPLKLVCYHSDSLQEQKRKTMEKAADKEQQLLKKLSSKLTKGTFACLKDAQREQDKLLEQDLKKIVYHQIDFTITTQEKRKPGRPSRKPDQKPVSIEYKLNFTFTPVQKP